MKNKMLSKENGTQALPIRFCWWIYYFKAHKFLMFILQVEEKIRKAIRKDDVEKLEALSKEKEYEDVKFGNLKIHGFICHVAAECGNYNVFTTYSEGQNMVDTLKENGDTWLHSAARRGEIKICEYIVRKFKKDCASSKSNENHETVY